MPAAPPVAFAVWRWFLALFPSKLARCKAAVSLWQESPQASPSAKVTGTTVVLQLWHGCRNINKLGDTEFPQGPLQEISVQPTSKIRQTITERF